MESRIAVLPYENQTNDPELDALGNMAADWITRALINLQDTKVLQFNNVKDHLDLVAETVKFAERTGAERLIRRRFYQVDEELIFESQIVDPRTSEVVFVLPVVRGTKDRPSEMVTELSQHIGGYFALDAGNMFGSYAAPKYEQAIVYAGLGEKDKAVQLMKQAFREGCAFEMYRYDNAFEFIPLHGYAPFEAFVRPKYRRIIDFLELFYLIQERRSVAPGLFVTRMYTVCSKGRSPGPVTCAS